MKIQQPLIDQMIDWRRQLHQIPELGNDLPETTRLVRSVLEAHAIPYQTYLSGNGIVATITGNQIGATVGLRADMDGLPVVEETGLSFSAKGNTMHACGHDGHTAMALAAAVYLKQLADFPGTVKVLFQPGEESPGGAEPMIAEGAIDGFDAIFGLHHGNFEPMVPRGCFGIKAGHQMAASDKFTITVTGKGGHGGIPQNSIDPIIAASQLVLALQSLVSRETSPTDSVVLSVTKFQAGQNHNIIPGQAHLAGTVRTISQATRRRVADRMAQMCQLIGQAFQAEITIEHEFMYPTLVNDSAMTELAKAAAAKLVPSEQVVTLDSPMMASEDFAYYLEKIPGCFMHLSNPLEIEGRTYPLHHAKFAFDESYLTIGANFLIQVALDFLEMKKTGG